MSYKRAYPRAVAAPDFFASHRSVEPHPPSPALLAWLREARPPGGEAVVVLGVMQRSGTNFLTNLLALHPKIHRHPRDLWEVPLLGQAWHFQNLTADFFDAYKPNRGRFGEHDLMALCGYGLLTYLQAALPHGHRVLLTHPGAEYLDYFHTLFPCELPVLLMRDGRDVVVSTCKTWPGMAFDDVCARWQQQASMMLRTRELWQREGHRHVYITYETIYADPTAAVRSVCEQLDLEPDLFPYHRIATHVLVKGSSTFDGVSRGDWEGRRADASFKPVGRFHEWTAAQKDTFKHLAGETLIAAGYCADLDW